MRIRAEQKNDRAAVYQINAAAFETRAEAELVETLRACVQPLISLVAEVDAAVVVLGHPEYYPRFGFLPASRFGLRCEYNVPDETFLAMELEPGAFERRTHHGWRYVVKYHVAFSNV